MSLSRSDVISLFRCFLGREPDSQSIDWWIDNIISFDAGRNALINSPEFRNKWFPSPIYEPGQNTLPVIKHAGESLAISIITKNESKRIDKLLLSCSAVADFFAVLDTGSTDGTEKVVEQVLKNIGIPFTVKKSDFRNFAQARNEALELIPPSISWILVMDSDEHLVNEDHQKLLDLLVQNNDGWRLPRYNFNDAEKKMPPAPYPDYQARLFRNRTESPVRYSGLVHELPQGVSVWKAAPTSDAQHGGPTGGPHIHHMGQATTSPDQQKIKHELYNYLMTQIEDK